MAKTITAKELKRMEDGDERFVLVNVLDSGAFEDEHICGSINIPLGDIDEAAPVILGENDEKIIVYCAGPGCTASAEAANKLEALGYRDVVRYTGGMEEWTKEGYCTEGAAIYRRRKAVS